MRSLTDGSERADFGVAMRRFHAKERYLMALGHPEMLRFARDEELAEAVKRLLAVEEDPTDDEIAELEAVSDEIKRRDNL